MCDSQAKSQRLSKMKFSVPRSMNHLSTTEPPILFDRLKSEPKGKHLVQTFKCRTIPVDVGLPTYKVVVPYFSSRNSESWIQFQKCLDRLFTRQGDTTSPSNYNKLWQLLQGETLAVLEMHVIPVKGHIKTNDLYILAVNSVSEHVFFRNAVKMQKCFLRWYLSKLDLMSTRQYVVRVSKINGCFAYFPKWGKQRSSQKNPSWQNCRDYEIFLSSKVAETNDPTEFWRNNVYCFPVCSILQQNQMRNRFWHDRLRDSPPWERQRKLCQEAKAFEWIPKRTYNEVRFS